MQPLYDIDPSPVIYYRGVNDTVSFYFEKTNDKVNHTIMSKPRMAQIFKKAMGEKGLTTTNWNKIQAWFRDNKINPAKMN